jgi:hypothetical protein
VTELSGEERDALVQFARDVQTAAPQMREAAQAAQRIFHDLQHADTWRIAETPKPDGISESSWSVGHAKVNYVDKIARQHDNI